MKLVKIIFVLGNLLYSAICIRSFTKESNLCGLNISCGIDYECCETKLNSSEFRYSCSMKDPDGEICAYVTSYKGKPKLIEPVCDLNKKCANQSETCYLRYKKNSNYEVKCSSTKEEDKTWKTVELVTKELNFLSPSLSKNADKLVKITKSLVLASLAGSKLKEKAMKSKERLEKSLYEDVNCSERKTCGSEYSCCYDQKWKSAGCQLIDQNGKTDEEKYCSYGYLNSKYEVITPICDAKKPCQDGKECCFKPVGKSVDGPTYLDCKRKCGNGWTKL